MRASRSCRCRYSSLYYDLLFKALERVKKSSKGGGGST